MPAVADDTADFILRMQERMVEKRANFNNNWQTVADLIAPNYAEFTTKKTQGERRTNKIFESTGTLALQHFCSAIESMVFPFNSRWHGLRPVDPALRTNIEVMQYMDQMTDILFQARYAPSANFQSQMHEAIYQIGAFGTGPFMVDDIVGYGLRYRSLPLTQTYGMENAVGMIDWVQCEYELTARGAVDSMKRGIFDLDSLPPQILEANDKDPNRTFTFIHAIYPANIRDRKPDSRTMDFSSCQVSKEFRMTLKEAQYATQPIYMPRYTTAPREVYGRGPGLNCLPDLLMLQEMEKTNIQQAQRAAAPPILLADDGSLQSFNIRSNALNYGMLSPDGKPLAAPFQSGANFQIAQETMDQKRQIVQKHFLNDVFSILTQEPGMTATEVMQRAQERGYLVTPIISRLQTEMAGPMITREIDILHRAGQFPPPPDVLKMAGHFEYEVFYDSAIQTAQKNSKALAISQVFQNAAPIFQIDPKYAKRINGDRTLQILADALGAPSGMLNTDDEQQAEDAAAAQQANMTNLAQLAGPASQAIKNISQANQAASSAQPGQTLGGQ